MLTAEVIHRIYRIKYKDRVGTCFTIDEGGQRYLITAKHIVKNITGTDIIQIDRNNKWEDREVNLIGHGTESIDISVLTGDFLTNNPFFSVDHLPLPIGGSIALSQDIFFIGFPNVVIDTQKTSPEFLQLNRTFPLPIARQGIVSWMDKDSILIDAYGNTGFSGSPVICKSSENNKPAVTAVIANRKDEIKPVYKTELQAKNDSRQEDHIIGYYRDNSGIITAYDIKHALNLINSKE